MTQPMPETVQNPRRPDPAKARTLAAKAEAIEAITNSTMPAANEVSLWTSSSPKRGMRC